MSELQEALLSRGAVPIEVIFLGEIQGVPRGMPAPS